MGQGVNRGGVEKEDPLWMGVGRGGVPEKMQA